MSRIKYFQIQVQLQLLWRELLMQEKKTSVSLRRPRPMSRDRRGSSNVTSEE